MASCSFRMSAAHLLRSPLSEKVPRSFPLSSSKGASAISSASAKVSPPNRATCSRPLTTAPSTDFPKEYAPSIFPPFSARPAFRRGFVIRSRSSSSAFLAVYAVRVCWLSRPNSRPISSSASRSRPSAVSLGAAARVCSMASRRTSASRMASARLSSVCVPFVPEAVGREGEATRPFGCAHDGAAELSVDARFRTTCTCSFVGFADP